jgi:hypothetical protein
LQQENDFQVAGSSIMDRMKQMGSKMDDLERSISDMMTDAGLGGSPSNVPLSREGYEAAAAAATAASGGPSISPAPSMEEESTTVVTNKSNNSRKNSAVL